jgi:tetratricopeptide (TPR) repeat protein
LHPRKLLRLPAKGTSPSSLARPALGVFPAARRHPRPLPFAAALVAVALGLGCGARPAPPRPAPVAAEVRRLIDEAERAELARDHFVARRHYEAAVAAAVSAGDTASIRLARRELAETLISWGELGAAAAQLEQLVAAAADDASAWHDLGLVRHGAGDLPGAAAALARAKALQPRDPRPRIALAALQWKRGDKAAALVEYRALLELELPDRVREKVRWAIRQLEAS